MILSHLPSGILIKTVLHYGQEIKSRKFCAYDYGPEKNMQIYNATVPPDYDLSQITVPIALFHGGNDYFSADKVSSAIRYFEEITIN